MADEVGNQPAPSGDHPRRHDRGRLPEPAWEHLQLYEPEDTIEPLPFDMDNWWSLLANYPILGIAVDARHEGLLLAALHPSFALVAFTAAIETAAQLPDIGADGKGASARFWFAVEWIASP